MDDEIAAANAAMADQTEVWLRVSPRASDYRHVVQQLEDLSQRWQERVDGWTPETFAFSNGDGPDGPFVDVSGDYPIGVPSFPYLLGRMLTLHVERNNAYVASGADPLSNYVKAGESIGVPGWKAAFMRMTEKQNRLQNVLMNSISDPESAEDNLLDIAVIALLTLDLWKRGR